MEKENNNAIVHDDAIENAPTGAEANNQLIVANNEENIGASNIDSSDEEKVFEDASTNSLEAKSEGISDDTDSTFIENAVSDCAVMGDDAIITNSNKMSDAADAFDTMQMILNFAEKAIAENESDKKESQATDSETKNTIGTEDDLDKILFSTLTKQFEASEKNHSDLTNAVDTEKTESNDENIIIESDVVINENENTPENTDNSLTEKEANDDIDSSNNGSIDDEASAYADDDGFILEDEFSDIPDSFFDEDISDSDDASSISALLYNDDDTSAVTDFEARNDVSFIDLKKEMQKIKEEAMDLGAKESEEVRSEEIADEATLEEPTSCDVEANEEVDEEISEEANEESIDEKPLECDADDEQPENASEKKSYIRESVKEDKNNVDEDTAEEVKEHVITINRARIREKTVPDGRFIDTVFEAIELFTFTVLALMIVLCFVFRHSAVSGDSMMPTFNDGDRLIVTNLLYTPKRGDVVVFDDRSNEGYEDEPIIKRIIGLEGDTVKIEGGIIYVKEAGNDEFHTVNYVSDMDIPNRDMDEVIVPAGEMFVMGDNVNNSKDSRDPKVGTVKIESIIGKVVLRFYISETIYSEEENDYVTKGKVVFDTDFKTNH